MLTHPTMEKLRELRLTGMADALEEQLNNPEFQDLDFDERLGLLVDREATVRHNRRLQTRLKQAQFQQPAAWEDIDFKTGDLIVGPDLAVKYNFLTPQRSSCSQGTTPDAVKPH